MKCIQVSNKSKRDQILTELTALYTVSNSGLAKFENLPCPNKINLGISAQNSSLSPEESTNIKRGLETITVLAKEVKSRGPNTIKLTLPLPLPLPPPIWPKTLQRCHTVPLSGKLKECIIHPSVLSTVSTIFPVLDADSALSNRMKVLNVDRAKGALSASIPSWQPIITSSEGEVRNNSVERSTDDSIPDTQGSSLGHEDEFLPSSNVPTFTEGRQCGPCPYVVTFYDAYTDPANEGR